MQTAPTCNVCLVADAYVEYDPDTRQDEYWPTCHPCWKLVVSAPWCGCIAQSTHMTPVVSGPGELTGYRCSTCGSPKPQSLGPWEFTPATGWVPKREAGETDTHWAWRDGYGRAATRRFRAETDRAMRMQ